MDVFDAVLVNEGYGDLVSTSRILNPDGSDPVKQLGKPTMSAVYSPFSFQQIAEFIIFLPLNLVPVVGIPMFMFLTGYRAGPLHHWRYLKLLDLTNKERNEFFKRRRLQYTCFGTVALLLQLIPVMSMLFLLTSAAGSALWAVNLEKTRRELESRAYQEGLPQDHYVDDPAQQAAFSGENTS